MIEESINQKKNNVHVETKESFRSIRCFRYLFVFWGGRGSFTSERVSAITVSFIVQRLGGIKNEGVCVL